MKKLFLIFVFFVFEPIFSQDIKDIDKLTIDICNSIVKSNEKSDSVRIQNAFNENLIPLMQKFKLNDINDDLASKIEYRLQKNCDWYQKYLSEKYGYNEKSDWQILEERPISVITTMDCKDFFKKYSKFYYFESEGEKTFVEISNNFWIDKFEDNTFSKLEFILNDCHFDLKFVESNNLGRNNFSSKGDIYYYDVISRNKNVLTVIAYQKGSSTYYQFKLYAID